jgi:hypothetical protein
VLFGKSCNLIQLNPYKYKNIISPYMNSIGPDCRKIISEYLTPSNRTILKQVSKEWYKEHKNYSNILIKEIAVHDAELIPHLVASDIRLPKEIHTWIIQSGSLPILKWLEENGYKIYDEPYVAYQSNENTYHLADIATEKGDLNIMKWIHSKNCFHDYLTFSKASKNGNLENMKWLLSINFKFDRETFDDAALNGNLENMKWLKSQGCFVSTRTLSYAALNGNLDNMKWLLSNGCDPEYDGSVFYQAIVNGNLENMKWLKEAGCRFDDFSFKTAARYGNLETMKWLKEQGCEFYRGTFEAAAKNGNIKNMEWLKDQGCKFDSGTFEAAAENGNIENMEWLKANNCPYNKASLLQKLDKETDEESKTSCINWMASLLQTMDPDEETKGTDCTDIMSIEWIRYNL